jgi:hypothetical protein
MEGCLVAHENVTNLAFSNCKLFSCLQFRRFSSLLIWKGPQRPRLTRVCIGLVYWLFLINNFLLEKTSAHQSPLALFPVRCRRVTWDGKNFIPGSLLLPRLSSAATKSEHCAVCSSLEHVSRPRVQSLRFCTVPLQDNFKESRCFFEYFHDSIFKWSSPNHVYQPDRMQWLAGSNESQAPLNTLVHNQRQSDV